MITRFLSAGPPVTSWYSYDDVGNRISHSYRGDTAIGYEHDKANRMTTIDAVTQGYDDAGNVTLAYSLDRGAYHRRCTRRSAIVGVRPDKGRTAYGIVSA